MRILVMLKPTNKRVTNMAYTKQRKLLVSEGFQVIKPELLIRVTTNRKSVETYLRPFARV